jgi:hypothetical protein
MTVRYVSIALAAASVFGLAACEADSVAPASSGPAAAGAPNAAPEGSTSSGQPVRPRSWAYPPETPPLPPGSP